MGTFLNEPYSTFSKRLTDWLNTAGGEVSNLSLDLFNRAQARLWHYRAWDGLVTHYSMTLTNKAKTLPSDFGGTVCRVYCDTNSDGKPDRYYYRDGPHATGYKLVNVFVKATGHSWTITFFMDPPSTPIMVYPKALDDFTGTSTEYSFFPPDLLLATAKAIHIEESDLVGAEYQAVLNQQATLLRDYEAAHQYQNTEFRMAQIDENGDEIAVDGYDLDGGSESDFMDHYDNDYDMG
jgi:hypothetical protein